MERVTPEVPTAPIDLGALDEALAREDARPIAPWKAGGRQGARRSTHGRS